MHDTSDVWFAFFAGAGLASPVAFWVGWVTRRPVMRGLRRVAVASWRGARAGWTQARDFLAR